MSIVKSGFYLVVFFLLSGYASAVTSIGSCQTISASGEYELSGDLTGGVGTCISITATSVTLDCLGHWINSTGGFSTYGIDAVNANHSVIRGCLLSNMTRAISVNQDFNVTVFNNTILNTVLNYGILVSSGSNNTIVSNSVDGSGTGGIYSTSSPGVNISFNSVNNTGTDGIYSSGGNAFISSNSLRSSNRGIMVELGNGNRISSNILNQSTTAIYVYGSANNTVSSNSFNNSGTAIYVSHFTSDNNTIFSNTLEQNGFAGLRIEGDYTNITSNTIFNTTSYAIYFGFGSSNNTISANVLRNTSYVGAYALSGSNNNFSFNTIVNTSAYGINLASGSGNIVEYNVVNDSSSYGIFFDGEVGGQVFSNVLGNSYGGILVQTGSANRLERNTVSNSYYGIFLAAASSNNMTNNSAINISNAGITSDSGGVNNTFSNNSVRDSGSGIQVNMEDSAQVVFNTIVNSVNEGVLAVGSGNRVAFNTINDTLGEGIEFSTSNGVAEFNSIRNASTGILMGGGSSNATSNTISNGVTGIRMLGDGVRVVSNAISGQSDFGIYADLASSAVISLSNVSVSAGGLRLSSSTVNVSNVVLSNPSGIEVNLSSSNVTILNLTILREGNGSVRWNSLFANGTVIVNGSNFFVGNLTAAFNDSEAPDFNSTAVITLLSPTGGGGNVFRHPEFVTDYSTIVSTGSPYITTVSYNIPLQQYVFTVTNFSSYALVPVSSTSTALVQSVSPPSPQFNGTSVTFSCNYTNSTGAVSDASVNVSLDGVNRSTVFSGGVFNYTNSSIPIGIHSWQCLASATGQDSRTGSLQSYEIFSLAPTYLYFSRSDGSPYCQLFTSANTTSVSLTLVVNSNATCDAVNIQLNATNPSNSTSTLNGSCSNGIHSFNVSTSSPGSYTMTGFSTNTSYSVPPVVCVVNAGSGERRAFPDSNPALIVVLALLAVLWARSARKQVFNQ